MPNLPISGLPVTATPLATDELANEQSLVTKKITLQQVSDFVQSDTSFNEHEVLYGNNTGGTGQSDTFTFNDSLSSATLGGQAVTLNSANSLASGVNITVDASAESAVVFGRTITLTSAALNTFTWSDGSSGITITDPNTFNVRSSGFSYFDTPEIRTTADRIHFNKEVISASYTPEITGLVVADGPIQIGAPLKQSPTTDFRVMQISSGDSSATGIIGFAVTAAAIAGDIIEISDFKIVTCQLSPTEFCSPGEATRKSSTAGRIQARTTLTSTGTFGSTAQTGVANDFIKVWIIHNEVAGLTTGSRREIRIQEYDDGGAASSGVSRPYPGITVFVVSPGVDDRTGLTGIILPADFDPTTDVDIEINWAPTTAAAGNVVWQVNYSFLPLNGTIALNSNLATINTTESASTNAEFPGKSTVTLNTGSALPGDQLFIHVTRMGSDVLDTYPDDVWITSISPFYISTIL